MTEIDLDRANAINWVSFYLRAAKALRTKREGVHMYGILEKMGLSTSGQKKALRRALTYGIIRRTSSRGRGWHSFRLTQYGEELLKEVEDERMAQVR